MARRKQSMEFRELLKLKPKGLAPVDCLSKVSPQCKETFIPARKEQTMCLKCLDYYGLLEAHPMIISNIPEDDDDSFVNQL